MILDDEMTADEEDSGMISLFIYLFICFYF
jgi:hypothetical protein